MAPRLDGYQLCNATYRANLLCGCVGYEMLNARGKYISVVLERGGVLSKPRTTRPEIKGNIALWEEAFPDTDVEIVFGFETIQFLRIIKSYKANQKYKWRITQEHPYDVNVGFVAVDANRHILDLSIKEESVSNILLPRNTTAKVKFIYDELTHPSEVLYPVVMC